MNTTIVWFRNDLRIHDHPALWAGAQQADRVVPVFIFNDSLLRGKHSGSNRNRFLLESLINLKNSLQQLGADLVIRIGAPAVVLRELAAETQAKAVFYTADYTPYAIGRDKAVKQNLEAAGIKFHSFGGRLIVDKLQSLHTKTGTTHKVFTPFWKNWMEIERRPILDMPTALQLPDRLDCGIIPDLADMTTVADLSANVMSGGESAGRQRMNAWLGNPVNDYHQNNDQMGADGTSRLSPYLHFGCISARELESRLPDSPGARAYNRQLCWRDFYHYILFHYPTNASQEFQKRYQKYDWNQDLELLTAWQQGRTGYPVVDAAMRQLNTEGWMHNRARLIVGSFLTKDLGLDWRVGESYFMRMLLDGDEPNNNGNWQWIASVGVDPAPVFRRLYNPVLQQQKFDADNSYVHRYVPSLRSVPDAYITEPWKMPAEVQAAANCRIGSAANCTYPAPIVDHAAARLRALDKYRHTADTYNRLTENASKKLVDNQPVSRETAVADAENQQ